MFYQKNKFIFIPTKIRKMIRTFIIRTALAMSMLFLIQDQNFAQNRPSREMPPGAPSAPAAPGAGMLTPPMGAPKTGPKPYKEVITGTFPYHSASNVLCCSPKIVPFASPPSSASKLIKYCKESLMLAQFFSKNEALFSEIK